VDDLAEDDALKHVLYKAVDDHGCRNFDADLRSCEIHVEEGKREIRAESNAVSLAMT
jgi:hypothetical protein